MSERLATFVNGVNIPKGPDDVCRECGWSAAAHQRHRNRDRWVCPETIPGAVLNAMPSATSWTPMVVTTNATSSERFDAALTFSDLVKAQERLQRPRPVEAAQLRETYVRQIGEALFTAGVPGEVVASEVQEFARIASLEQLEECWKNRDEIARRYIAVQERERRRRSYNEATQSVRPRQSRAPRPEPPTLAGTRAYFED